MIVPTYRYNSGLVFFLWPDFWYLGIGFQDYKMFQWQSEKILISDLHNNNNSLYLSSMSHVLSEALFRVNYVWHATLVNATTL